MNRLPVWTLVRAATVLLVVAAIATQAVVGLSAGRFDPTRFFAYFTIQSNVIGVAAFVGLLAARNRPRGRGLELLRGAAVVYLTVTFFVVIFLLSNIDVGLQLVWVDVVLHKVFPIVMVADWLLDPPRMRLGPRDALAWLVYPIAWVILTLIRGAADGWYPYPFLDPANGGYAAVAVAIVAITVGFLLIAAVTIALGNARRGGASSPEPSPAT